MGALGYLFPGQTQAGGEGSRVYASESGDYAARHARDSRDGEKDSAPGRDRIAVREQSHESIERSSTQEGVGKAQTRRPRYGVGHGQDLHAWTQRPALAQRLAYPSRL